MQHCNASQQPVRRIQPFCHPWLRRRRRPHPPLAAPRLIAATEMPATALVGIYRDIIARAEDGEAWARAEARLEKAVFETEHGRANCVGWLAAIAGAPA